MEFTVIILIGGLNLIGLLYFIFFKSYSNEKGKNHATKEDIEEITSKIETIRKEIEYQGNIKTHRFDLKRKACLNALRVANSVLSNYEYDNAKKGDIKPQYMNVDEVRACIDELACTCETSSVLDILKKIMFEKVSPVSPDIIVDLRNAIRNELGFSNKEIDTDREKSFIARVNCEPKT